MQTRATSTSMQVVHQVSEVPWGWVVYTPDWSYPRCLWQGGYSGENTLPVFRELSETPEGLTCKFSSVAQSCPTLCDPMDSSTPGFPVLHHLWEPAQTPKSVMPSNHLILCHPLLLLPSIFPTIGVFSSELVLHIRWPKYWNFSFSTSPSNEYSRLISFRMDWLDLLAVQETLKSLLQHHSSKASIL